MSLNLPSNQQLAYSFVIVTPSFNQADYIVQTVESVLGQNQEKQNFPVEYWVMDGDSSDDTVKKLRVFKKKIGVVSEKDKGQTNAINKGIKQIQTIRKKAGKESDKSTQVIFAYINSDDYYLPGSFQKVVDAFAKNSQKKWLVGDCIVVNQKGKEIHTFIRQFKKLVRKVFQPWMLFVLNPIPQPAVFIKWEAVQKAGYFNEKLKYTMDYEYWLRMERHFGKPIFLSDELASFRIHPLSKGGSQFEKQFKEQYQVARNFTQNPIFLLLHLINNGITTMVYSVIK